MKNDIILLIQKLKNKNENRYNKINNSKCSEYAHSALVHIYI